MSLGPRRAFLQFGRERGLRFDSTGALVAMYGWDNRGPLIYSRTMVAGALSIWI
jgi:hypothetical protein